MTLVLNRTARGEIQIVNISHGTVNVLCDDFRPHSTDSFTHRKMTLSLADRSNKAQKVKVLPIAGKDPDAQRSEMIKVEDE